MSKAKKEASAGQQAPLIKSKLAPPLGFRTPSFFRGSKFGGKQSVGAPKFNASQFRTQHKGGS